MATLTRERARVAYTISGNSPEVRTAPEGASQANFKIGAMVFMSASGRLRFLPTANLSRADVAQGIAGMANEDSGNYTNSTTEVEYTVANDDTVFLSNIASRFSTATATLAYKYIGTVCGGSVNGSRFYPSVRMVAATNSLCIVRGFVAPDTTGDTYGRVYFQFLRTARAFR